MKKILELIEAISKADVKSRYLGEVSVGPSAQAWKKITELAHIASKELREPQLEGGLTLEQFSMQNELITRLMKKNEELEQQSGQRKQY